MRAALEFLLGPADLLRILAVLLATLEAALEFVLGPADALLGSLPLWTARVAVALLLVLPAAAVWRLDRDWVLRGAPNRARWRDLRVWAVLFVVPYLVIYLFLA